MPLSILNSDNVLNVGTVANDNTGDNLRTAGQKINVNFEALDSAIAALEILPETAVTNSTIRYDGTGWVSTDGLKVDGSDNTTVGGNITFSDSDDLIMPDKSVIKLGNSAELQIYHDGGNNRIRGTAPAPTDDGNIIIENYVNDADVTISTDDGSGGITNYIVVEGSTGEVQLNHYGSQKFNTDSTGVNVTGNIAVSGTVTADGLTVGGNITFSDSDDLKMPDKSQIKLGNADDFLIYYDGTNGRIRNVGTSGGIAIENYVNDADVTISTDDGLGGITNYIRADGSTGEVQLNHYGSQKFNTDSTGVNVTGNIAVSGTVTAVDVTASGDVTAVDVTASGTIQDAQGNVRALERTAVTTTPFDLPANSSGKYFSMSTGSSTFTIDAGDCEVGQIITIFNFNNASRTISWTNMTNGVYIAGHTTSLGTNGSTTLVAKGLVTIINDTADRLIMNGNLSS